MSASVRKTFKYKLKPTAEQARELERVLGRCRRRYNVALQQRITAWHRCHVAVTSRSRALSRKLS